jgi:carbon storage regulator
MLVLSRRKLESIVIHGGITIDILQCSRKEMRLGITAPSSVKIVRRELLDEQPQPEMVLAALFASA